MILKLLACFDMVHVKHLFSILILAVSTSVSAETPLKKVNLEPSQRSKADGFGSAVVIADDHNAVGAPAANDNSGSVYIFKGDKQTAKLSNNIQNSRFGASLAYDSDILIVGAPSENKDNLISTGAVYIYKWQLDNSWALLQKIVANDAGAGDYFGASVAIEDNHIFIGAHLQDAKGIDSGAVYHFVRSKNNQFVQKTKIVPGSLKAGALFGNAIALDDDTLAIGAYGYDGTSPGGGAVYMFERNGNNWDVQLKLEASKRKAFSEFGWSIALDDNYLVVSSPYEDKSGVPSGVAYVFYREELGGEWMFHSRLRYRDDDWKQRFAGSVSMDDTHMLIGAPYGIAYHFQLEGDKWIQKKKFVADTPGNDILFSRALALDDNRVLMGVPNAQNNKGGKAFMMPLFVPSELSSR